ncbi:MAG: VTT domain-containing protein [Gemmatimonadetes bacterium]|nr:VTT domain-containing protein [Gemmatimonadota bacterium]
MHFLSELFQRLRDLPALVQWAGYVGLTIIIFVETGTLAFFLPGDSLLVTAGLLASQPSFGLNVWLLGAILSVAAVVGDTISYTIGHQLGPRLFTREDSFWLNKKHLKAAHDFYEKHGGKTIILARFVPIIRTFAPVVAGAASMRYASFLAYNVVGGIGWVWSMLLAGYWLGQLVPGLDKHIEKLAIAIVLVSVMPMAWHWYRERQKGAALPG